MVKRLIKEWAIRIRMYWFSSFYKKQAEHQHNWKAFEGKESKERCGELAEKIEELENCLAYFGIEITEDQSYQFKPSRMKRFRRTQMEKEDSKVKDL